MKARILVTMLLGVVFAISTFASYPNNYTLYRTVSQDGAGNLIVSATVTGTTLPPVPPMTGATHMAQVNMLFNSGANWKNGQSVCTSCNVNFNGSWIFSGLDSCFLDLVSGCTLETTAQVNCTFAGVFWNVTGGSGAPKLQIRRAITLSQNTAQPYLVTGWLLAPQCSSSSAPPDFNMDTIYAINGSQVPYSSYYKGNAVCYRAFGAPAGTAWSCPNSPLYLSLSAGQAVTEITNNGDGHGYFCTNFDRHISGLPWP